MGSSDVGSCFLPGLAIDPGAHKEIKIGMLQCLSSHRDEVGNTVSTLQMFKKLPMKILAGYL